MDCATPVLSEAQDATRFAYADDRDTYPRIRSYAAIGDCRSIALVSRQGSVDWLCLPRFDSPSVFAALLDRQKGGRFALRPRDAFRTERRYVPGTNVLQTDFITRNGIVRLHDAMPINRDDGLQPERELLRIVEGLQGEVRMEVLYEPRPAYARANAELVQRGRHHWVFQHDGDAYLLASETDMHLHPEGDVLSAWFVLPAGQRQRFSLCHATRDMLVFPALGETADARLEATAAWWRGWSGQCSFAGCRIDPARRAIVLRSALTLKLLTYSLSGAVVAAATTSLPEAVGGTRNWDYRFCWPRDTATTLRAFNALGLATEAQAFLEWLLHATRLTRPRLMVLYDVHGRRPRKLETLGHLAGYRNSAPVRVGNDAVDQLQLDVYGSVVAASADHAARGAKLQRDEQRQLIGFGKIVCAEWEMKDSGLWEVPGAPRHYVHSKLLCWSALDKLIGMHEAGRLVAPVERFRSERAAIRQAIETYGVDPAGETYVGAFGEDWPDASLLLMTELGYAAPDAPRIVATAERILRELDRGGLLLRYPPGLDGLPSQEGTFTICAFWAAEMLALQGRLEEAEALFARGLSTANDLGLLAEEFDPVKDEALGNFPQAFSHAGLISAAMTIARATAARDEAAQDRRPACG